MNATILNDEKISILKELIEYAEQTKNSYLLNKLKQVL